MLHLFNPDNDLALAADLEHYTPPKAALQLKREGELLPLWYGNPGDRVIAHGVNAGWLDRMHSMFSGLPGLHDHGNTDLAPSPWGWSKAARLTLCNEGADPALMPSDGALEKLRDLSHRRTASLFLEQLQHRLPGIRMPHPAIEARSIQEIEAIMNSWGDVYIKQPWSGSGRGVISSATNHHGALRLAETSIRTQGSVMIEEALPPGLDFARLFRCTDGKVEDLGTSVFTTDTLGHYTGNLLAPEPARFARVAERYPADDLLRIFDELAKIISEEIAPDYNGVLGVDMLVSADGRIHPAVEINLRHTMGYVANRFAELHMHPDAHPGRFEIRAHKASDATAIADMDFVVTDNRLLSGTLPLIPESTNFEIVAKID